MDASSIRLTDDISPVLQSGNSQLISASELNQWADRNDAKQVFPELMRRLLAQTPGITNIDIRAREGVAAPGWDGSATSTGSSFLPVGELHFEFGTDKDPKRKAEQDYEKRVNALKEPSDSIFVFATPRNWPGARKWAEEHTKDGKFARVEAMDAHRLEGWLQLTPPVHYWISERLGRQPEGVRTLDDWWRSFQPGQRVSTLSLTIPIPPEFFQAGRSQECAELNEALMSEKSAYFPIVIQSVCQDDALAFMYAAFKDKSNDVVKTLLVKELSAWVELARSSCPTVLVPLFESVDIQVAIENGHRVILLAKPTETVRQNVAGAVISLPKVDRVEASEVLQDVGIDYASANNLTVLARRSMPRFLQSLSFNPLEKEPTWVRNNDIASILRCLILVGSWSDDVPGDRQAIREVTGVQFEDITRLLDDMSCQPDSPFIQSGGQWRLADPKYAISCLASKLDNDVFIRWKRLVLDVLLADDPFQEMNVTNRLVAEVGGAKAVYSDVLGRHVAEGLAVVGVIAQNSTDLPLLQFYVNEIVRRLFEGAEQDASGRLFTKISSYFPYLAEASPEVFQEVLEADLKKLHPLVKLLFQGDDERRDIWGPRPHYPKLLWALERLCWSQDYYGRAARLLATVVSLAPRGSATKMSLESLCKVTAGWLIQSNGSIEDKITVVGSIVRSCPNVGWRLVTKQLFDNHVTISDAGKPAYRDWEPQRQEVMHPELDQYFDEMVDYLIDLAGDDADRWADIVQKVELLADRHRDSVIAFFEEVTSTSAWGGDERYNVWRSLTDLLDRYRTHSESEPRLSVEELASLRKTAAKLFSATDPRRYSPLFGWRPTVDDLRYGDEGYGAQLDSAQKQAVKDVALGGVAQVKLLVENVDRPDIVGELLARASVPVDSEILDWLENASQKLRQAALAYSRHRICDNGIGWLHTALNAVSLSNDAQALLMAAVPFRKAYWDDVASMSKDLVDAYWRQGNYVRVLKHERPEAAHLLLEHGHPWEAIQLLEMMLLQNQAPELNLVKSALYLAARSSSVSVPRQDASFSVGNLLEFMESEAPPDDSDLPDLEFQFFDFLYKHQPSTALYRHLCNNTDAFVSMIDAVCAIGESEEKEESNEKGRIYKHRAWSVLFFWPVLPGFQEDGSIDEEHLSNWVTGVREKLKNSEHIEHGDEYIGQVLSSSPKGSDGIWPAEEVRGLIETLANSTIDSNMVVGRLNQRDAATRGRFDGGTQERAVGRKYAEDAKHIATQWPRTAAILRSISDSYKFNGSFLDRRAERMADE
jgi:hypothetical protein